MAKKCDVCGGRGSVPAYPTQPNHEWGLCKVCGGKRLIPEKGEKSVPVHNDPYEAEEGALGISEEEVGPHIMAGARGASG